MEFKDRLKARRHMLGISQEELAKKSGVTGRTIQKLFAAGFHRMIGNAAAFDKVNERINGGSSHETVDIKTFVGEGSRKTFTRRGEAILGAEFINEVVNADTSLDKVFRFSTGKSQTFRRTEAGSQLIKILGDTHL